MDKPEILAPAGDLVSLKAAIDAGADAVYFGVKGFNMRASAKNFEISQLKKIVSTCHDNKVKSYLTINIIVYEEELKFLDELVKEAKKAKIDAIICWDFSVIHACRKYGIEFHISTQASISNFESLKHYHELGATRAVLARECNLNQIKEIKKKIIENKLNVKIETFVHGAMCVSVSGRCFISQFLYGKSANRGECLQPCRRSYRLVDKETDDELEIGNDYVLSPKDMNTIDILDRLIEAGIDSFKIEGRMRSPEYVSAAIKAYRLAVDEYFDKGFVSDNIKKIINDELSKVYNRGFSQGFYMGKPMDEWTDEYGSKSVEKKIYLGKVKNYYAKISVIEMKLETEDLNIEDIVMVQGPTTGVVKGKVLSLQFNSKDVEKIEKRNFAGFKYEHKVRPNDKVFLIKNR